ncbi:MAG: hypothetical protein OXR66_01770 [Candidatus Woesearchaeota archaeon]|nr:hypothetical protein [Candidatus Woesearchaeota archaeon]
MSTRRKLLLRDGPLAAGLTALWLTGCAPETEQGTQVAAPQEKPTLSAEEVVREGVRAFADQALQQYEQHISPRNDFTQAAVNAFANYAANVRRIRSTEDITSGDLRTFELLLGMQPRVLRDAKASLDLAASAVQAFYEIESERALYDEIKIPYTDGQPRVSYSSTAAQFRRRIRTDGSVEHFLIGYANPTLRMLEVVLDTHELHHGIQDSREMPEAAEWVALQKQLLSIGSAGVPSFVDDMRQDARVRAQLAAYGSDVHLAAYFTSPEGRAAVTSRYGAAGNELLDFATARQADFDFVKCMQEGDAYATTPTILAQLPLDNDDTQMYVLMGYAHAFFASLQPQGRGPIYNRVGLGLASYFKQHEAQRERAKSPSFRQAVAEMIRKR